MLKDITAMINPDYNLILENFHIRPYDKTSDSTYILRMMLFRAANEADRRYYLTTGEQAKECRRISYELDELSRNVEEYLDGECQINPGHTATIIEALTLAGHLILLDQWETGVQYEALMRKLVYPRKDGWPEDLAA